MAENRKFDILGVEFEITQPFDAGHVCTDGEAKALNQLFKENLANNYRGTVKEAQEAAEKNGSQVDTTKLADDFAKLVSEYAFTISTVSAARKFDPIEREARNMVSAALREHFKSQGKKFSDLPEDQQEALIEANASRDEVVKAAKAIVKQRQNAAGLDLNLAATEVPTDGSLVGGPTEDNPNGQPA